VSNLSSLAAHRSKLTALSLPLFVLRIGTDHSHHTTAVNNLALIANFLYRCSNFHKNRPWSFVVGRSQNPTAAFTDSRFPVAKS
jgi:hypothetical protein